MRRLVKLMLAVTYSIIRNKLKDYCNQATDNHETVIVTRKGEKERCNHES